MFIRTPAPKRTLAQAIDAEIVGYYVMGISLAQCIDDTEWPAWLVAHIYAREAINEAFDVAPAI